MNYQDFKFKIEEKVEDKPFLWLISILILGIIIGTQL